MILAIIQARLDSTRLPGKVLMDLWGKPILKHVIDAARLIKSVDLVMVATCYNGGGPVIAARCEEWEVPCYLHDQPPMSNGRNDVLGRFVAACNRYKSVKYVVRICGDSPLLDSQSADALCVEAVRSKADYCGYRIGDKPAATVPTGYFAEVVSRAALEVAHRNLSCDDARREHVTACMYEPGSGFTCRWLKLPKWYSKEPLRLAAVDTMEDFVRVQEALK